MDEITRRAFLKLLSILGIGAVASRIPVNEKPRTIPIHGIQATLYWDGKEIDLAEINSFWGEPDGSTWSGEDDGAVYTVTLHAEGIIHDGIDFDELWES